MMVYKLTEEMVEKWKGVYGVHEFAPIQDADGNYITTEGCANNEAFPFCEEIKLCEQIEFNPKKEIQQS